MILQENMVVADRFRLVRMIGKGGMGSVWQAHHLSLDMSCAVKFIEGELANVAEAHARFEREAKAAAQLKSPHVVQILDHGVWQGMPYIAMELLEGEDLGKRLGSLHAQGKKLSPFEVGAIMQQVCRALSKAHAAGVVHRDLKPDNIFLVKDDDREIVKILDFGVAKQTAQALDGSNTKTGAMLGTPYYMSPEQAQGIKSVDSRSDLWSLAVIVFQAITARLPFESEALGDLLVKIIVSPIPRPSEYFPGVPPGFDAWWARASDRNPDGRFQTAKEFSEALDRALSQPGNELDRTKLQKLGGSTALMQMQPPHQVGQHMANTPWPQQNPNPAATAALMQTPNPHGHGGGPMPSPMYGQVQAPPVNASTGNPVARTFNGTDQAPELPKKPPVAIFAGIGAIALIGIVLGGVALYARANNAPANAGPSASEKASASASASVAVATTDSAKAPDPPASASAPPAADTASAAATAAAAAEPTAVAAATHRPSSSSGGPAPVRTSTPKSPTTAAASSKPPAGGKEKPINLGF